MRYQPSAAGREPEDGDSYPVCMLGRFPAGLATRVRLRDLLPLAFFGLEHVAVGGLRLARSMAIKAFCSVNTRDRLVMRAPAPIVGATAVGRWNGALVRFFNVDARPDHSVHGFSIRRRRPIRIVGFDWVRIWLKPCEPHTYQLPKCVDSDASGMGATCPSILPSNITFKNSVCPMPVDTAEKTKCHLRSH